MDPLSDVLSLLRLRSHVTAGFDAGDPWAVRFDDQAGWIKCYAVTHGSCLLSVEDVREPVLLAAGDCFVLPSGRSFTLASDLGVQPVSADEVFSRPGRAGVVVYNGGGGLFLTGARFEVEGRPAGALLRALPPVLKLDQSSDQAALRWSVARMEEELRTQRPGSMLIAQQLAGMMLVQALRLHLYEQSSLSVGWFFALADPRISAAMTAMHEEPARHWSLSNLAGRAGLSRSTFAERFRTKVGETPMAYLARWRMMLATKRLAEGTSVGEIGRTLGYQSNAAFNTAFTRVMGCSPRRYARGVEVKFTPPASCAC